MKFLELFKIGSQRNQNTNTPTPMKLTAELMKITPELASDWLANKWPEQRSIRKGQVARLAGDMLRGQFKVSPDAITRIKGQLANGQHRLQAVVESGKAQTFIVLQSDDAALYKIIDAGLRRTVADGLGKINNAKHISAAARWVSAYNNDMIIRSGRSGGDVDVPTRKGSIRTTMSQLELIEYCEKNLELLTQANEFVMPLYAETNLLPLSMGGAIYAIAELNGCDMEKTQSFLRELYKDGGPTVAGDLRNRLIANRGAKAKLQAGFIFGLVIKALAYYLRSERPGVLRWAGDEAFPRLAA